MAADGRGRASGQPPKVQRRARHQLQHPPNGLQLLPPGHRRHARRMKPKKRGSRPPTSDCDEAIRVHSHHMVARSAGRVCRVQSAGRKGAATQAGGVRRGCWPWLQAERQDGKMAGRQLCSSVSAPRRQLGGAALGGRLSRHSPLVLGSGTGRWMLCPLDRPASPAPSHQPCACLLHWGPEPVAGCRSMPTARPTAAPAG